MRSRHFAIVIGSALSLLAGSALAQGAAAPPADSGPRKDPQGVKGISPFWEAVKLGDDAFVARDYATAESKYREALTSEPKNALGHYRIGEVHIATAKLDDAFHDLESALRFVGEDHALRAKILFVQADLRERNRALDKAKEKWGEYDAHAKAHPEEKTYPATPPERVKRIDTWIALEKEYASVKERIKKREAELDAKEHGKKS